MKAFIRLGSVLIKAYDEGDDWQTVDSNGGERWRSKWQHDVKRSLEAALNGHAFSFGYTEGVAHLIEYVEPL
jgi:hypothetical protein